MNNDLKYCEYVLTLSSNNNNCKDLQEYLKVLIKEVASNKFNISALQKHRRINATDLVKYMAYDEHVLEIIQEYSIVHKTYKEHERDIRHFIDEGSSLPSNIFGIFMDYLLRYEISKIAKTGFNDDRANSFLEGVTKIDGVKMPKAMNTVINVRNNICHHKEMS